MEIVGKLRVGMTRKDVVHVLGLPDHIGGTSRKHKIPSVYKYGDIELHFGPSEAGTLEMVYTEDRESVGIVLLR